MVQFINLPETTQGKLGREMGTAFGTGMAKNLPDPQLRMQGRMQEGALNKFQDSLVKGDDPRAISIKWGQAMAGIPGSEELSKTVLQPHLQYAILNMDFDERNRQGGQGGGGGGQQPPTDNAAMESAYSDPSAPIDVMGGGGMGDILPQPGGGVQQPGGGGMGDILPQPGGGVQQPGGGITQPSGGGGQPTGRPQVGGGMNKDALQLSMLTKQSYEKALQQIAGLPQEQINALIEQARQKQEQSSLARTTQLSGYAKAKLPEETTPDNLNDFMRIGQSFDNQGLSREDWFRKTQKKYKDFTNGMNAYKGAYKPDWVAGLFSKDGKYRASSLKRMESLVKPVVDAGFPDRVREDLSLEPGALTPTEIEMLIKPVKTSIESLPKAPYLGIDKFTSGLSMGGVMSAEKARQNPDYNRFKQTNPGLLDQMTDKYSDFLLKNVKDDVSILGLRDLMSKNKNVDWRHYKDIVDRAIEKGLNLNAEQQSEMRETTMPPRDSLTWIFHESGRFWNWIRGAK